MIGSSDVDGISGFFRAVTSQLAINNIEIGENQKKIKALKEKLDEQNRIMNEKLAQCKEVEGLWETKSIVQSMQQSYIGAYQTSQLLEIRNQINKNWLEIKNLRK